MSILYTIFAKTLFTIIFYKIQRLAWFYKILILSCGCHQMENLIHNWASILQHLEQRNARIITHMNYLCLFYVKNSKLSQDNNFNTVFPKMCACA